MTRHAGRRWRSLFAVCLAAVACTPASVIEPGPDATSSSTIQDLPLVPADSTSTTAPARFATAEEIAALLPSTPVTTAPPGEVRASKLERQERKLACLRRNGFEGEIDKRDLGILMDVPEEQMDRFIEVSKVCSEEEFERHGLTFGHPTREELETAYRVSLYVRECMIAEGYPTSRPPTLESYIESLGANWHPYNEFMGAGGGLGFSELEEVCPQDGFYLREVLDLND